MLGEETHHDESQKKRKLTNDSGYGDDMNERCMDSLLQSQVAESFTRTSSLDSISEDHSYKEQQRRVSADLTFQDMTDSFQKSLNCNGSPPEHNRFDSTDGVAMETQIVATSKTKEKRRRMTPVPCSVHITKPSQSKCTSIAFLHLPLTSPYSLKIDVT
jgi:hypothetical protein